MEAKAPRPRPLILGAGAGGGGPMIDSSGSESLSGEGERFLPMFDLFSKGVEVISFFALDLSDSRAPLSLDTDDVDLLRGDRRR